MGYIHCWRTKLEWKSAVPESTGLTGPKGTKSLVGDRPNAVTGRRENSGGKWVFFVKAGSSLSDDFKKYVYCVNLISRVSSVIQLDKNKNAAFINRYHL